MDNERVIPDGEPKAVAASYANFDVLANKNARTTIGPRGEVARRATRLRDLR